MKDSSTETKSTIENLNSIVSNVITELKIKHKRGWGFTVKELRRELKKRNANYNQKQIKKCINELVMLGKIEYCYNNKKKRLEYVPVGM